MFEGPVTGNIPEVLDNGEVTDGTHVTAGQLALALTPYAQVTHLAVNTAASGNNAAAIQSLDDRVTAELASKLDSSALTPAIAPLATAAALATTDGQVAAHGSSIAALQSSLTTGLSNKADQSAFDVLEGVVATKSTPDSVDLKLSNYSTTAAMNGSIASSLEVDSKIATALLDAVTAAALDAALLGKADASALASLLSAVDGLDTPLEVDTKIANALLGLATEAFVAAQLASRDASITALQGAKADATLLASYATNAALSASETALQSALDAILAELAALQLSGSGGVVNAPAWAGFTTWELVRGSNVVRNLHFVAPLSAALANGDDTLSITADCYSTAGTDAAIAAALLAYYTSSQVDTLLGDYRTGTAQDAETTSAITAALLAYYTSAQVDALLGDYRTASAQDTQTQAAIAGALLAYRTGPDQDVFTDQPNHLGAGGVPLSRRPGHGDGLEHRRRAAQLLHHRASRRPPRRQARSRGGSLGAADSNTLSRRRRGRRGGGRHNRRADPGPHGRLAVKLDGSPQQRLQRGLGHAHRGRNERGRLHPDPGGEPVEHRAHLQLDPGPRAPLRLPLPARHGLQLRGVHVRGRQRL